MNLGHALALAQDLAAEVAPYCARVQVAGKPPRCIIEIGKRSALKKQNRPVPAERFLGLTDLVVKLGPHPRSSLQPRGIFV